VKKWEGCDCPYCSAYLLNELLQAFDRYTTETLFQCPTCGQRMWVTLRWRLGNSLCGVHIITLGKVALELVTRRFGFEPTEKEMAR
jgi:hypothetical protein